MVAHIGTAERYYGADLDEPLADVLYRRGEQSPQQRALLHEASESIHQDSVTDAGRGTP